MSTVMKCLAATAALLSIGGSVLGVSIFPTRTAPFVLATILQCIRTAAGSNEPTLSPARPFPLIGGMCAREATSGWTR